MNSINMKIALSAIVVLAASAAQANDYLAHRDGKAPGLNSYATVHRLAPTPPAWSAWDPASQPTDPTCPEIEGYPGCH
jgi:hypothetical protein